MRPPRSASNEAGALWPILGGLRFFLALIVTGAHLTRVQPGQPGFILSQFSGLAAVLGFLVVSGFSIAASLDREPKGFYFRRGLRIYPLYILMLAASVLIPRACGGQIEGMSGEIYTAPAWSEFMLNLVFMQGILVDSVSTNAIVWTLSIEVVFYALAPLLTRLRPWIILGCAMISGAAYMKTRGVYFSEMQYGMGAVCLGWAWLLGFWAYQKAGSRYTFPAVLCFGFVILTINRSYTMPYWGLTWIVTAAAIELGAGIRLPRLAAIGLSKLGDASYPLYLSHLVVFMVLDGFSGSDSPWVYLGISLCVALLLDRLYDQPVKTVVLKVRSLLSNKRCAIQGRTANHAAASSLRINSR